MRVEEIGSSSEESIVESSGEEATLYGRVEGTIPSARMLQIQEERDEDSVARCELVGDGCEVHCIRDIMIRT